MKDTSAFQWIYQKMAFILGGLLIPLDFYPEWLQAIAKALPFASMTYGPARLFVSPTIPAFLSTLAMQAIWILVLAILLTITYRRNISHLALNGG